MLKQTVEYVDFNDQPRQEDLYFNLTKSEIGDNLRLIDRLETLQVTFQGDKRELSIVEVEAMLNLVKDFMRLSYGIRSDDGRRFIKGEQTWEEFTQTAAYDAFLMGLFENPEKILGFLTGILPKDWRETAENKVGEAMGRPVPQDFKRKEPGYRTLETPKTIIQEVPVAPDLDASKDEEAERLEFEQWKASRGLDQ